MTNHNIIISALEGRRKDVEAKYLKAKARHQEYNNCPAEILDIHRKISDVIKENKGGWDEQAKQLQKLSEEGKRKQKILEQDGLKLMDAEIKLHVELEELDREIANQKFSQGLRGHI